MKPAVLTFAMALVTAATTGCNKAEPVKPAATGQEATSEADAAKVADATVETNVIARAGMRIRLSMSMIVQGKGVDFPTRRGDEP